MVSFMAEFLSMIHETQTTRWTPDPVINEVVYNLFEWPCKWVFPKVYKLL